MGAVGRFAAAGARLISIPVDEAGMDVEMSFKNCCGWGCGSPELVKRLDMFRPEGALGGLVAKFDAPLQQHIQVLRQAYRRKRDLMLAAIQEYFPQEVRVMSPQGGFFVWVELPCQINAQEVLRASRDQGVTTFLPGSRCYAEAVGEQALRLAFSYQPPERILSGLKVIGTVLKTMG